MNFQQIDKKLTNKTDEKDTIKSVGANLFARGACNNGNCVNKFTPIIKLI